MIFWPGNLDIPMEPAALLPVEYLNAVIDDDVFRIDGVKRDTKKLRLFITENQPPFASRIRSSVRTKQAEKRHFVDSSLACAILGVNTERLIGDLETAGFLFEALCERDLRIYAESCDAASYYYQDYVGKEIDAVVEFKNGDWIAFKIKLGANQIDTAAENLLAISNAVKKEAGGVPPKALCVICGLSNAVYQRPDGVYVVPITALR